MRPSTLIIACLSISLTLISGYSFSQEQLIKKTIINAETGEPVSYATIYYPEQEYGFSANDKGEFQIKFKKTMADQAVSISSIGYEVYESSMKKLLASPETIRLKPKVTVLKEIMIQAKAESPKEMIRNAEKNLKDFLRQDPYYLFSFYNEQIIKNDRHVGLTDAYGVFHISGYQPSYNRNNEIFSYDLAQWKNIRRSQYFINSECIDSLPRTLEIDKITKAKSEYLYNGPFSKRRNEFRYTIDSATSYHDEDVFIISFTPIDPEITSYKGSAYIKADDYAMLRLEIWDNSAENIYYQTCPLTDIKSHFSIDYIKAGEKYYVNKVNLVNNYSLEGTPIEERISIYGGEFKEGQVNKFNEPQRRVIYSEMINPDIVYDPEFWKGKEVVIADSVAEALSAEEPLSEQFFKSSGKRVIPLPDNYTSYQEIYNDNQVLRIFLNGDF